MSARTSGWSTSATSTASGGSGSSASSAQRSDELASRVGRIHDPGDVPAPPVLVRSPDLGIVRTGHDHDLAETGVLEVGDDRLEKGGASHGQQRLGEAEPRRLPSGQHDTDDSPHPGILRRGAVGPARLRAACYHAAVPDDLPSLRCQRCGTVMDLRDPAPGAPWAAQRCWVCPSCGRHFWTTYPAPKPATPAKDTAAPAATVPVPA